ncbi:MAG: hypothetical protein AB7Q29_09990 [Vicinamibacterales bacterium]
MRRSLLLALVTVVLAIGFTFGTGAAAQDEPFLGTWDMSLERSSITRGSPPKSETIVNVPEPGGFTSTNTIVSARGTNVEVHHYLFDGQFHGTEGGDQRELSFVRTDRRTIDSDTRRNGEITVKRRIQLSEDGRTMTMVASGRSGGGQPYANDTRVYEKR